MMHTPSTEREWLALKIELNRLFSAAPLSPLSISSSIKRQMNPGRVPDVRLMLRAVRDPAKHILLYGERGVGKTSLSNTFWLEEDSLIHPIISTRVPVYPTDNFSSLWLRALREFAIAMEPYDCEIVTAVEKATPDFVKKELQKAPPRTTPLIVVDEFDLLRDAEARELTAHLLKTLHDAAINVTILLVGVAENVDELIENHQSLRRVLCSVKLKRMGKSDLQNIITQRLRATPLEITEDALCAIISLSCGLPYYVQV